MREGYIYFEKINSIKLFCLLINTHKTQNALFSFFSSIYVHIYQREEERDKKKWDILVRYTNRYNYHFLSIDFNKHFTLSLTMVSFSIAIIIINEILLRAAQNMNTLLKYIASS